ncbi:MAG TPA: DNA polymerase III subunit beta [Nitrospinae bacterium]|nr:DNA polymerase III subunit beta [Nitrospinota bacterium]
MRRIGERAWICPTSRSGGATVDIVISRETLHRALQTVQGVVESRSSAMPVLQHVLLVTEGDTQVRMLATNLDIGLKGVFEAEIKKGGSVTLNARKLFDIVRELPDADVHLVEENGQWVRMTCERSNFRFPGLPPSDFPSVPEPGGTPQKISAKVFGDMIRKTMFAISQDETRYTYNGVFMESEGDVLRLVATDGHRLAMIERPNAGAEFKEGVIIHKKALGELVKLLSETGEDVEIYLDENHVIFTLGTIELSARLIDGDFPKYRQVIPEDNKCRIITDRDNLLRALRRVSLLSNETKMVKFVFTPGQLILTTNGSDAGEAEEILESDYSGEELTIGFNARYCLDVLGILEDQSICFELKDSLSPGIFKPKEGEGYIYVIMPMRV